MQQLLDKLISGEGKLSLLLIQAREIIRTKGDEDFLEFVNNEIDGYSGDEIPDYRKIKGTVVGWKKRRHLTIVKRK